MGRAFGMDGLGGWMEKFFMAQMIPRDTGFAFTQLYTFFAFAFVGLTTMDTILFAFFAQHSSEENCETESDKSQTRQISRVKALRLI